MKIQLSITINGTNENVWKVITDIEGSVDTIKGIRKIEILEKPAKGFTGLKWRETRSMFGQTATEIMWISSSEENNYYETRAESHGAIYTTRFNLTEKGKSTLLTMSFGAEIISLKSKVISLLTGWIFIGATKKALMEDLNDIKNAVEQKLDL